MRREMEESDELSVKEMIQPNWKISNGQNQKVKNVVADNSRKQWEG